MTAARRRPPRLAHDLRVFLFALAAGLPAVTLAIVLLWTSDHSPKVRWTLTTFVLGSWLMFAMIVRERVIRPLQTLSNMVAALREGDFSLRGRVTSREDALGLAYWEANTLSVTYMSSPEVTAAMTAAANGGADLIVYNGHGNSVRLGKSAPRILDTGAHAARERQAAREGTQLVGCKPRSAVRGAAPLHATPWPVAYLGSDRPILR